MPITEFLPDRAIVMRRKSPAKPKNTSAPLPIPQSAPIAETAALTSLDSIAQELVGCTRCKLSNLGRKNVVVGEGNPKARLMFVGEAPGEDEDVQGVPFIGRAGELLIKMIEAMGLKRSDVYIANVVKCRPPENRNPETDEIATCSPYLQKQIDLIQPEVIVALGKFASQTLLGTETRISDLRGTFHTYRGRKLMPTFHPAYLLRNPSSKKEAWEDLKKVATTLGLKLPKAK